MDSHYLSVKEVANLLHKSEKWVYVNKGEIPGFFMLAKSIFFDRDILVCSLKTLATHTRQNKPNGRNDPHGLL
jgi:hypothetical protein